MLILLPFCLACVCVCTHGGQESVSAPLLPCASQGSNPGRSSGCTAVTFAHWVIPSVHSCCGCYWHQLEQGASGSAFGEHCNSILQFHSSIRMMTTTPLQLCRMRELIWRASPFFHRLPANLVWLSPAADLGISGISNSRLSKVLWYGVTCFLGPLNLHLSWLCYISLSSCSCFPTPKVFFFFPSLPSLCLWIFGHLFLFVWDRSSVCTPRLTFSFVTQPGLVLSTEQTSSLSLPDAGIIRLCHHTQLSLWISVTRILMSCVSL